MAQNTLTSRQVEDLARLDAEAASVTADLRSGVMDCPLGMSVEDAIAQNEAFKAEVAKHINDGATYEQACQIAGLEQVLGVTCEDAKAIVMGQEDDVSVDATCPLDGTTDDVEDDTDGISSDAAKSCLMILIGQAYNQPQDLDVYAESYRLMDVVRRGGKPESEFEVIVGNVGTVFAGPKQEAERKFTEDVDLSRQGMGRAGNEEVSLIERDTGHLARHHDPHMHEDVR